MRAFRRIAGLAAVAVLVTACERPPVEVVQTGFRGLGIEHVENPRTLEDSVTALLSRLPEIQPPAEAIQGLDPAPAGTYENVQVLGHLSAAEFTITMNALTQWVAPDSGCAYCHVYYEDGSINYVSDEIYTKVVSRQMLKMVQDINTNWASHVQTEQGRGVNCWTCHQGEPVPTNYWFYTDENQVLRNYLDREGARVQGPYALTSQGENRQSIRQTEYTYALMMHMSNALGVNCTYCHNSARFADWEESSPQRVTALRGLRMIRDINMNHMVVLQDVWPEDSDVYRWKPDQPRLGPMGDGPKLQCATCHIGAYKPQYNSPFSFGQPWSALNQIGYPHPVADTTVTGSN
jgi:photosynthetic reaction center cytochrome c subunit